MLVGRQAYVIHYGLGRGTMGWAHVRVGAVNRADADKLCADLHSAGLSYCEVRRTRPVVEKPNVTNRAARQQTERPSGEILYEQSGNLALPNSVGDPDSR